MARRDGEPSLKDLLNSSRPITGRKFNVSAEYAGRQEDHRHDDSREPGWADFRIEREEGESHLQYSQRAKNALQIPVEIPWEEKTPTLTKREKFMAFFSKRKTRKERKDTVNLSDLDRLESRLLDKASLRGANTIQTSTPPPKLSIFQRFVNLFKAPPAPKRKF